MKPLLCGHPKRDRHMRDVCGWCGGQLCLGCCWWRCFADEWRLIGAAASVRPQPMSRDLDDEERTRRAVPMKELIARSSVGQGLRRIRENGVDAELAELDREMGPRRKR